jgi:hypothetical protein
MDARWRDVMGKFKVGDRVRSLDKDYSTAKGWPYGVIASVSDSGTLYQVDFEEAKYLNHFEYEMELATDIPAFTETPTLRDQFAMAALTGLIASTPGVFAEYAKMAYSAADAMIVERERVK